MRKAFLSVLILVAYLAKPVDLGAAGYAFEPRPKATSVTKHSIHSKLKKNKLNKAVKSVGRASRRLTRTQAQLGDPLSLSLHSTAALVVNQSTGERLYAKNPNLQLPIASITKLMTAMVSLDAGLPLQEEITINEEDVDRLKGTSSRLAIGTTLTREELLHLALIASENRAAAALSRAYPGGREAFIAAMNRKAAQLGMHQTHFVDGTGLSSQNRSTAADLVKLADAAYRYPIIRHISTLGSYELIVPVSNQYRHLAFNNTNQLTRQEDWKIGLSKTGYISESGHCLVMQARIAKKKVIIVLLDALGKRSRLSDANRIRQWLERSDTHRMASQNTKAPA